MTEESEVLSHLHDAENAKWYLDKYKSQDRQREPEKHIANNCGNITDSLFLSSRQQAPISDQSS